MKKCSKCKEIKKTEIYFYKDSYNKDGYASRCTNCQTGIEKRAGRRLWTEEEKSILKEYYPYMSGVKISEEYLPHRTPSQINDHANKVLKLKKDKSYRQGWTREQIEYLRENYENLDLNIDEIGRSLNKNQSAIDYLANQIGLSRKRKNSKLWGDDSLEIVKKYYPHMKTKDLQKKFFPRKTVSQITGFANRNGIYKSEKQLKKTQRKTAMDNLEVINNLSPEERKWGDRIVVVCSSCNKKIKKLKSKADKSTKHFCDYECMGEWMSVNLKGKNNPNYKNGETWTEKMRKDSAQRAVHRLVNSDFIFEETKPEKITRKILESLSVNFQTEYDCDYYLVDSYLIDYGLMIEVQGNFFHCNPTMELKNNRESKIIRKDKAKNTYIKNHYGVNILYLWEKDLIESVDKCTRLIEKYIATNGKLKNYHSFNYKLSNNETLKLKNDLVEFAY